MPERTVRLYLQDILDAIAAVAEYTKEYAYHDFFDDRKTADAVVRNLEIIGEAARQIPSEITKRFPDIPWEKMVSMRNKVIHEYAGVDLQILWQTAKEDLPELGKKLQTIMRSVK